MASLLPRKFTLFVKTFAQNQFILHKNVQFKNHLHYAIFCDFSWIWMHSWRALRSAWIIIIHFSTNRFFYFVFFLDYPSATSRIERLQLVLILLCNVKISISLLKNIWFDLIPLLGLCLLLVLLMMIFPVVFGFVIYVCYVFVSSCFYFLLFSSRSFLNGFYSIHTHSMTLDGCVSLFVICYT